MNLTQKGFLMVAVVGALIDELNEKDYPKEDRAKFLQEFSHTLVDAIVNTPEIIHDKFYQRVIKKLCANMEQKDKSLFSLMEKQELIEEKLNDLYEIV